MFFSFTEKEKNQKKNRRCSSLPSFHSAVTTCSGISHYRQSFFQVPVTAFAALARELMRHPLRMKSIENHDDNRFSEFSERSAHRHSISGFLSAVNNVMKWEAEGSPTE
jgi:hypothetical protein